MAKVANEWYRYAEEICRALGVDPKQNKITKFVIWQEVAEPLKAEVSFWCYDDQDELLDITQRFQLEATPIDPAEQGE